MNESRQNFFSAADSMSPWSTSASNVSISAISESTSDWLAAVWIILLVVGALLYALLMIQRSPYSMWENVLYVPTLLYGRLIWRVHFANRPPEAIEGGAVLVANHHSSVDPFFVQLAAGRRVHWMVAREYCDAPGVGSFLQALQVIPTNRSGMDTGATKQAIRLAKEGRLVGMFPEGRLNHTVRDPLLSIRPGAALVAMRAGVPLIPLYIFGSPYRREVWSPLIMAAHVKITFGQPIDPRNFAEQNTPLLDPADESSPAENADKPRQSELILAEQMILEWGKRIATMAGKSDWKVEIAGRSRLTRTTKENS